MKKGIGVCDECDFDETRNPLSHPTLSPVPSKPVKYRTDPMITPDEVFILAKHYFNGDVVKKDYFYAIRLLRHAAFANYVDAQVLLADCYRKGIGIKKNTKLANWWIEQAESLGYVISGKKVDAASSDIINQKSRKTKEYFHKPNSEVSQTTKVKQQKTNSEDITDGWMHAPIKI